MGLGYADRCKMRMMDRETEFAIREVMRDLGWLPSDLNCEEKRRLAEEYLASTIEWAEACQGRWMGLVDRLRQAYPAVRSTEHQAVNRTSSTGCSGHRRGSPENGSRSASS